MSIIIRPLFYVEAEELYPSCIHCHSILFGNHFDTEPSLEEISDWLEKVKDLERNEEEIHFAVWENDHRILGWLAVRRVDDMSDICYLDYNFCDITRLHEHFVWTSRYAIDYAFNEGFASEVFIEARSGDTVTRKLLEEIPLEISFTDTVACEHAKPEKECFYSIHVNDPVRDDWFSEDKNHCSGKEASEHPEWPVGHRFSNQSHNLSQDEIHYMNDGSQPLRGLS